MRPLVAERPRARTARRRSAAARPRLTPSTASHSSSLIRPSVLSRVMPALWTTMSTPPWASSRWVGDLRRGVVIGDVDGQRRAAEPSGDLRPARRPIAGTSTPTTWAPSRASDLGDRLADPARGAGDERDLAGERPVPVDARRASSRRGRCGRPGPRRTPTSARAGSAASTRRRCSAAGCDVHELRGRAACGPPCRSSARGPRARAGRSASGGALGVSGGVPSTITRPRLAHPADRRVEERARLVQRARST